MENSIRQYLAAIGRRGGLKSRRKLSSTEARNMVKVREAGRAFKKFKTSCFWSFRPDYRISHKDVHWVAEQLKKHGNAEAWKIAARLSQ